MANEFIFNDNNLSNCSCDIDTSISYVKGDEITISITADNGFYFTDIPFVCRKYLGNKYHIGKMVSNENSDFKTTYSITFDIPESMDNTLYLYGYAQIMPANESNLIGEVSVYNPTKDDLLKISSRRFENNMYYNQYVNNIFIVFVDVPTCSECEILLGGDAMGVSCNSLDSEIIVTDCGTLEIPLIHNNNLDYEDTKLDIYLPFIGFKSLDASEFIGYSLHLLYKTNILNGDSLACLYKVDENDVEFLVDSFNCNCGFKIPFVVYQDQQLNDKFEIKSDYLHGFTPIVRISRRKTNSANNYIGNSFEMLTLSSLSGVVKGDIILDNLSCLDVEKDMIKNVFVNGVII